MQRGASSGVCTRGSCYVEDVAQAGATGTGAWASSSFLGVNVATRGLCAHAALARTMLELRAERKTGTLAISSDGTRTFVHFREGTPVDAEDSGIEPMGRMLVRLGVLSLAQYRDVLSKLTEVLVARQQIRFGEAAVELGIMNEAQVAAAVHEQVRWRVARCFQRQTLSWSFDEGPIPDTGGDYPMAVEALLYIAMLWLDADGRDALGMDEVLDHHVSVSPARVPELMSYLGLDADLASFLLSLDGSHRASELVGDPPDDPRREALLCTLWLLGALRLHDCAQPRSQLPLERHPPLPASRRPAKIDRAAMERVFSRVANVALPNAGLFLVPSTLPEHKLLAEQAFQRGRELALRGEKSKAEPQLRRAVQLQPKCNEYALHALFCDAPEPLTARAPVLPLLRRTAESAVREDPNFAFGHYVLGCVAMAVADRAAARRSLARALMLDPTNTRAEQALEQVENELEAEA